MSGVPEVGPERTVKSVNLALSWVSETLGPPTRWEKIVLLLLRSSLIQRAFNRRVADAYLVYNEDGSIKASLALPSRHADDAFNLLSLLGDYALFDGARVLDVGCGDGSKSAIVASLGTESVVGVDTDPERIRRARARAASLKMSNLHFEVVHDYRFPAAAGEFDLVLLLNVMEHADDPARLLEECGRVLKPDGFLLNVFKTWKSPRGSHITDWVYIPWNHLLFPERDLVRVLKRMSKSNPFIEYNYPALASNPLPEDLVALADGGLNRLTLKEYLTLIEGIKLEVEDLRLTGYGYGSRFWLIRAISHLSRIPVIREYLGGWVVTVLRHSPS